MGRGAVRNDSSSRSAELPLSCAVPRLPTAGYFRESVQLALDKDIWGSKSERPQRLEQELTPSYNTRRLFHLPRLYVLCPGL